MYAYTDTFFVSFGADITLWSDLNTYYYGCNYINQLASLYLQCMYKIVVQYVPVSR